VPQTLSQFAIAFGAGVLSFLSPCVLPLIPGYLSFITGIGVAELGAREKTGVRDILPPILLFVLGFSVVFVALGASASALGTLLVQYRTELARVSGVLLVALGFFMLGVVKVPWLYGEARFDLAKTRVFGRWAALAMGAAFAFGWTPCVGPILAGILALAASAADVARGAALLATYSAGLALPFILVGLLFGTLQGPLRVLQRHTLTLNRVAGVLLMLTGVVIFFNWLPLLTAWVSRLFPFLTLG
jgi:cytochrome c-type biogenesis protein